jgi:AcrR family transcriptional regulator
MARPSTSLSRKGASQAGPLPRERTGRGERARTRILRAALEVLAERGVAGFAIDAVAERANASKATIYRHWASQSELLVAAMDRTFQPFSAPATGGTRSDLIALIRNGHTLLRSRQFPSLMAAFIEAAERDPKLKRLHDELTNRRREPIRHVLEKAHRAGEIDRDANLELTIDLLTAPAFYRRFVAHKPFDDSAAEAVVDYVLRAVAPRTRL